MGLTALITKWPWLNHNLHTKLPFTSSPGAPAQPEGEHAILKLQLPYMPESAKLELLSTSCVLQQERWVCSGAGCLNSRLGGISFKLKPFPLYPPFRFDCYPWGDSFFSYNVSVSLKFSTMLIFHIVNWFLFTITVIYGKRGNKRTVIHR